MLVDLDKLIFLGIVAREAVEFLPVLSLFVVFNADPFDYFILDVFVVGSFDEPLQLFHAV